MPIVLDSFAEDDFEADALDLVELTETRTLDRANRDLDLFTALLTVIDDQQREALVKYLREGPDDEGQEMPS